MDPKIWRQLPHDIIWKIIEIAGLSIDSRLAFGIKPKRLDEANVRKIWRLLKSRDGIIYNLETKSLHNFVIPGVHIVRRPIELPYCTDGLWVFNESENDVTIEKSGPDGSYLCYNSTDVWMTEKRVLIKGSLREFSNLVNNI
jgi:hypothetical protein